MKDMIDILKTLAKGRTYDYEFDGGIEIYCSYCDCFIDSDENEEHEPNCLMIIAKEKLADILSSGQID